MITNDVELIQSLTTMVEPATRGITDYTVVSLTGFIDEGRVQVHRSESGDYRTTAAACEDLGLAHDEPHQGDAIFRITCVGFHSNGHPQAWLHNCSKPLLSIYRSDVLLDEWFKLTDRPGYGIHQNKPMITSIFDAIWEAIRYQPARD